MEGEGDEGSGRAVDGPSPGGWDAGSLRSWAGKAAGPQAVPDRARAKARSLPDGPHEGTATHPFPVVDRARYLAMVKARANGSGIASRSHGAPKGRVRISSLHGIQNTVNRERLEQHLRDPGMIRQGTLGSGHGGPVDLPLVVKVDGRYVVHDGHHRLTAAWLRGDDYAPCRLVDLDGE